MRCTTQPEGNFIERKFDVEENQGGQGNDRVYEE